VFDRFYGIYETGVVTSFQQNRGGFIEQTFSHMIFEYPLGAGAGRWGMMNYHFARFDTNLPHGIWVEIQPTGWVVDGGIPLLLAYSGAVAAAMWQLYRISDPRYGGPLSYAAAVVFCSNLFVVGQSFAGPTFNTTLGIYFWLPTAAVLAALARRQMFLRRKRPALEIAHVH
jgi:hypothetical protein